MVNYRRNRQEGGTYFFTLTLHNRQSDLLVRHVNCLKESIQKTKEKLPFKTLAMVILPEHLHAIWKLPVGDENYSDRWRRIKGNFTKSLIVDGYDVSRSNQGRYQLWQNRFWEHTIRDEKDLETHIDYIHYNPVKHGLVQSVCEWPHSTFHGYVKKGILHEEWSKDITFLEERYGE